MQIKRHWLLVETMPFEYFFSGVNTPASCSRRTAQAKPRACSARLVPLGAGRRWSGLVGAKWEARGRRGAGDCHVASPPRNDAVRQEFQHSCSTGIATSSISRKTVTGAPNFRQ